jgi:hypothetical protein
LNKKKETVVTADVIGIERKYQRWRRRTHPPATVEDGPTPIVLLTEIRGLTKIIHVYTSSPHINKKERKRNGVLASICHARESLNYLKKKEKIFF